MLSFERRVVDALSTADDQATKSAVEAFVDGTLRDMPEHLRLGLIGESVLFGSYAKVKGATDSEAVRRLLDRWGNSRIGLIRQYVHLLHSLVLLGENELAPDAAGART